MCRQLLTQATYFKRLARRTGKEIGFVCKVLSLSWQYSSSPELPRVDSRRHKYSAPLPARLSLGSPRTPAIPEDTMRRRLFLLAVSCALSGALMAGCEQSQ